MAVGVLGEEEAEAQMPMVGAQVVALMTQPQQQQLVLVVLRTLSFGEQQTHKAVL
jgi:hypothetical protein